MRSIKIRLKLRLLQALYRPPCDKKPGGIFKLSPSTTEDLSKIDNIIEEKITPLLADFF